MTTPTLPLAERTDADLVAESLNGRPDAFRHIVERYQTLVCSLAYSATASVSRSEDVAQETFVTAWRQLPALREPEKLRSCALLSLAPFLGIAAGVGAHCLLARDLTPDRRVRAKRNVQIVGGWMAYIALAAGGEFAVHILARHMAWGDRMRFTASVTYWWLFVMATVTTQVLWLHRIHMRNTTRKDPRQNLSANNMPMKPGALAGVVAGMHLAMFSWL